MPRFNIPFKNVIAALGIAGSIAAYFAIPHEGVKHASYRDSGGIWTICRGHTRGVYEGMTATDPQCDTWYIEDENEAKAAFHRLVKRPQHPNVEASAIDFIFNAGQGNFASSSLRRYLNAGNRVAACNQYPRWKYAGGIDCEKNPKACGGVIVRRVNEKELCLSNVIHLCDYNTGYCEPVSVWASQHLDQPAGSGTPG